MLPTNESAGGGLVRLLLDISYDGSGFAGWARQPAERTVQGLLEDSLATILRTAVKLTCAGRTDSGVHARHQIAHFDLDAVIWDRTEDDLLHRLARFLPKDVRVNSIEVAEPGFDARYSALRRHYKYRICDDGIGFDPIARINVSDWPSRLDESLLNEASALLLGTHDFAAFCRKREGATTIRELQKFSWIREDSGLLVADIVADAFCHTMVRSLIGIVAAVGDRRRDITWPREILESRIRGPESQVAPAQGLTLESIDYPAAQDLAARAAVTRRLRELEN